MKLLKDLIEKINQWFRKRPATALASVTITAAAAALGIWAFAWNVAADNTSPYQLAPQQPNFFRFDTNGPFLLTNNQTITYTNPAANVLNLTLRQDHGLSVFVTVWQTNSQSWATTNLTLTWNTTPDNTNYTSGNGSPAFNWKMDLAGTGVGTNTFWTNWPATVLNNLRAIQEGKATSNNTNNIFFTVEYSYSGQ